MQFLAICCVPMICFNTSTWSVCIIFCTLILVTISLQDYNHKSLAVAWNVCFLKCSASLEGDQTSERNKEVLRVGLGFWLWFWCRGEHVTATTRVSSNGTHKHLSISVKFDPVFEKKRFDHVWTDLPVRYIETDLDVVTPKINNYHTLYRTAPPWSQNANDLHFTKRMSYRQRWRWWSVTIWWVLSTYARPATSTSTHSRVGGRKLMTQSQSQRYWEPHVPKELKHSNGKWVSDYLQKFQEVKNRAHDRRA
jgi:hypothetical protein